MLKRLSAIARSHSSLTIHMRVMEGMLTIANEALIPCIVTGSQIYFCSFLSQTHFWFPLLETSNNFVYQQRGGFVQGSQRKVLVQLSSGQWQKFYETAVQEHRTGRSRCPPVLGIGSLFPLQDESQVSPCICIIDLQPVVNVTSCSVCLS